MAVTYDTVGPATAAPATSAGATSLAWTHTTGAVTSPGIVIGVDTAASADGALTTTCAVTPSTGLTVSSLGRKETNAGAGGGYLSAWTVLGCAASTAYTVTITVTGGTPTHIIGGSFSFANAGSFGTPVLQNTNSTWAITLTGVAATSEVAAFLATGGAITTGANAVYNANIDTSHSTGADAGGHNSGTGSVTVTLGTAGGTSCAMIGVEVILAPTGNSANAVLAAGTGTAQTAVTSPYSLLSGLKYATAAADLGGNYGSWATPQYAEGGP